MPLVQLSNLNKYGNIRRRIFHYEGQFTFNPRGLGKFVHVQSFKYTFTHPYMGPILQVVGNKQYIIPGNIEVHPKTTFDDIECIDPKQPTEKEEWEVKSSSGKDTYKVRRRDGKFTCNCGGFWRVKNKDIGCRHVQEISKNLI